MSDPNDEFGDNPSERCLFTIDAIRLENPEYYATVMKTIEQMNKDGKTDEVQRAYYCKFVRGEGSYFDPKRISACFTNERDFYSHVAVVDVMADRGRLVDDRVSGVDVEVD